MEVPQTVQILLLPDMRVPVSNWQNGWNLSKHIIIKQLAAVIMYSSFLTVWTMI